LASTAEPYEFKPHERPYMPGSPATPEHPLPRRVAYFCIGILLGFTGGFGNAIINVNVPQFQGALGLDQSQAYWVLASYSMTNVCMSMLLIKFRQQFGLQHFTRIFLMGFAIIMVGHLFVQRYESSLVLRAASGVTASGVTTLSIFYVIQSLPATARLAGFAIGFGMPQIAAPFARVISPLLLVDGNVHNLYYVELGLTLLCLACVGLLRLPPSQRIKAFEPLDFLTFGLLAPGMGLLCAVLTQGRILWWTQVPWLGIALAASIVMISGALWIEHNRANPLLNTRWLASRDIIRFGILAVTLRVLLAEQAYGSVGLLNAVGLNNDEMVKLFLVITLASIAGLVGSVLTLNPLRVIPPIILSVVLIAIGAFMDAQATNLTRPTNLYLSQALIGFAAIFFMGPVMMLGMLRAMARGPNHIVSFSALFGITQTVGGLAGSALLGSFQIIREKYHSHELVQQMVMTDPLVAARVQQLGGAYGRVLGDPALRQAEGATLLAQQVSREANILAYNDLFMLIFVLACIALVWIVGRFVRLSIRGINPLAGPLEEVRRYREALQEN